MHQIKFVIPFLFCLFCAEEKTKEEWWHKKADVMVEKQIERRGVKDPRVLKVMREHAIIMHPLPRVDEIVARDVDSDPRAAYFRQAHNGLYVRMALLRMLLIEGTA